MTRRLTVRWPSAEPFAGRDERPIRILAVSDEPDPTLDHPENRARLGPIDLVLGCGDLGGDYLGFVGDAFCAPIVRVLGNHDRPAAETAIAGLPHAPEPVRGGVVRVAPLPVAGLSWPGRPPLRDELEAWRQAWAIMLRNPRRRPLVIASHVPPRGIGDMATDAYHLGSPAYRWLMRHLRPPLWLHGHTPPAGVVRWVEQAGATTVVNVTGSVLVEVRPPEG